MDILARSEGMDGDMVKHWYYALTGVFVASMLGLWLTTLHFKESSTIENQSYANNLAHFSDLCPIRIPAPKLSRQISATVMTLMHGVVYIGNYKQAWVWRYQNWRFQVDGEALQGQTMGTAISQAFLNNHMAGRGVLSARLTGTGWAYEVAWNLRGRCHSFRIDTESPDLVKLILLTSLRTDTENSDR